MTQAAQIKQALASIMGPGQPDKTLQPRPAAQSPGAARGDAKPKVDGSQQAPDTGVASPLVETAWADRTFHDAVTYGVSNGMFTFVVRPVATVSQKDAGMRPVSQEFKAPP